MTACAYCEQPLICESCGASYVPPTRDQYEALSHRDEASLCPECGEVLVCHWCKSAYDGPDDNETDAPSAQG